MTKQELEERAVGYLTWKGMTKAEAEKYFRAIWDNHSGEALRIPKIMQKLGLDRAH